MEKEKYLQLMNKIDKAEDLQGEEAKNIYLEVSEEFLNEAKIDKEYRLKYIDLANKYYDKSGKIESHTAEEKPKTKFSDICGLDDLKEEIRLKIIEPLKYPEIFKKFKKKIGGGVIMYGPPGCGKTLISEAAANEADVKFFNLNAASLRSKYVGESEKNIANIFKQIRKNTPCIVFFDEFENFGEDRNISSKHSRNEVSQLLQEMDGFGKKDNQILFVAATNAPWFIDIALRREGRFGSSIFVGTPDLNGRRGIFINNLIDRPISSDVNFNLLAEKTNYFSGAEIVGVCDAAAEKVLKDFMKSKLLRKITMNDLEEAIKKKKPIALEWAKNAINSLRNLGDNEFLNVVEEYYNKRSNLIDS